eukprot:scaffold374_cov160-Amphora_coffeaeformis.AAC.15
MGGHCCMGVYGALGIAAGPAGEMGKGRCLGIGWGDGIPLFRSIQQCMEIMGVQDIFRFPLRIHRNAAVTVGGVHTQDGKGAHSNYAGIRKWSRVVNRSQGGALIGVHLM